MKIKNILVIIWFLMVIFACESQITSDCDYDESVKGGNMSARFSSIQSTIFNKRCISCHSGSAASAGLNLTEGNAYLQLKNKNLVIAGNSASSIFYTKLNSDNPNNVMPPSGKIAQTLIDSIAVWIDKGAPDN